MWRVRPWYNDENYLGQVLYRDYCLSQIRSDSSRKDYRRGNDGTGPYIEGETMAQRTISCEIPTKSNK